MRDGCPGSRTLANNYRHALAAEELRDCSITEVRSAGSNCQRCRHQNPAGGRIAIRQPLEDLQRRHGIQLGPAANRSRYPHSKKTFAMERLYDGFGQLAVFVTPLRVFVGKRCYLTCAIEQTGRL
jgi:hypothetical protein